MTATYTEAVDAIFALFNTAWLNNTAAIVGSVPEIRWQGVELPTKVNLSNFWCMVGVDTITERQTTFKTGVESSENKRYTTTGVVVVQLFCPLALSNAMDKGRQLAVVARNAFRGKETTNGVWFRNSVINELPPEESAYRFNIIAEYTFDDLG